MCESGLDRNTLLSFCPKPNLYVFSCVPEQHLEQEEKGLIWGTALWSSFVSGVQHFCSPAASRCISFSLVHKPTHAQSCPVAASRPRYVAFN